MFDLKCKNEIVDFIRNKTQIHLLNTSEKI